MRKVTYTSRLVSEAETIAYRLGYIAGSGEWLSMSNEQIADVLRKLLTVMQGEDAPAPRFL